ncbi:MAG: hypothetical protein M3Q58_12780 [Bacteroidota bacterium]|nr:hypothetical protein [Bacteroidota bacterium]
MEKHLTQEESLEIINRMVKTARYKMKESDSYMLLLWGYVVFAAAITHFLLLHTQYAQYAGAAWLLIIVGIIGSIYFGIKESKEKTVKTYVDTMMTYTWIAFGVCIFIVLFFGYKLMMSTYPVILLLYGISLFISGGAYKFKPLIIGGIVCWICSVGAFMMEVFSLQILILAFGVLAGYIIPGHLLKSKAAENV